MRGFHLRLCVYRLVRMCASWLCLPSRDIAGISGIHRSPRGACCVFSWSVAAGVTWANRTTSAPWAARSSHTSVIDAAGAIYVIGGFSGGFLQDVWVSADGGAWPDSEGCPGGT